MEILLFDEITADIAQRVAVQLADWPDAPVTVRINSFGGDPTAAVAIHNTLKARRGKVTVRIEGICASAATLIACAGHCVMPENSLYMMHGPSVTIGSGNAPALRERAGILDRFAESMLAIYTAKTHRPAAEIRKLLADGLDHFFTAAEALAFGLIDEIVRPLRIAARLGTLKIPERYVKLMAEIESTTDPVISAVAQERSRITEIRASFSTFFQKMPLRVPQLTRLQEQVITAGCSPEEADHRLLELLGTFSEPLGHGQGRTEYTGIGGRVGNPVAFGGHDASYTAAARDGLAITLGARLTDPHPDARDFVGRGLSTFAAECLSASGSNPVGLSAAGLFKAAMTTSDFPNLLSTGATTALVSVFESAASEHRALCDIGDAPDFKPQKAISMGFFGKLLLKPETAEIPASSISESAEPYQVATYARLISLSREALTNDNLGALAAAIRTAALAAARTERDLVFGVLTANKALSDGVALFHATHGNLYAAGTGSPVLPRLGVDVAGLGIARSKMRRQKDASGGFVMTAPRFIATPVALESNAEALIGSLTYRPDTASEISTPSWVKTLQVIADPRLDEVSELDWYLLSDPGIAPVIRLAFLNEQRGPTFESDENFERDVTSYKVRLDVAACAIGYYGAVKLG